MVDTVVIGAGPAGAAAAKTVANAGHGVVLLEQHPLPRVKSCSGLLIRKTVDLVKNHFESDIPADVQCSPIDNRGMIFFNENGCEYRFEQPGLNIWRSRFDHWLVGIAVKSGAQLRDNTRAVACKPAGTYWDVLMADGERLRAKAIILCEGAAGILTDKLVQAKRERIITFQTFSTGFIKLDPHYFYAFLQPEFSAYDAWFNVKDNNLIIGVAGRDINNLPAYHERFVRHLQDCFGLEIQVTLKSEKWLMSAVQPGCPLDLGTGSLLHAGEAAGLLNPMGEGISCGIESGILAGKAVLEYLDGGSAPIDTYRESIHPVHDYMLRQWRFVAQISSTFAHMA